MKILYSHRTKSADGQYVHIRALTDALINRGHDLRIVGPEGEQAQATRSLDAGTPAPQTKASSQNSAAKNDAAGNRIKAGLTSLMPRALYEVAELGYTLPAARRLSAAARQFSPDIIYERYNLFFHAGAHVRKQLNLPYILEVNSPLREERARHGGLALGGMAKRSETALWKGADAILPVTRVLADKLVEAGVDENRITVIQNGVEDSFLQPRAPGTLNEQYQLAGKIVLGFTGFVRDWHGVDRILKFMASHENKKLHLLLVGDGPARADLQSLAERLGLANRFTVTGVVQREDIPDHVALFDVALQPAVVAYASPLKLFEYMAMGKAIIAPDQPNIRETLEHGKSGLLFDPGDKAGLEKFLNNLVEDPQLRQRLGAAARVALEQADYTWAGNAARVETIANQLRAAHQNG